MATINQIYSERVIRFEEKLQKIKHRLFVSSMLRLLVFAGLLTAVYLLWGDTRWVLLCIVLGIALFLYLVSRHTDLQEEKKKQEALISINQTELNVRNGIYDNLPDGKAFIDSKHAYSHDTDLFGSKSIFQYLNRTCLPGGKNKLAGFFTANNPDHITIRQKAFQELGVKTDFRQNFSALALLTAPSSQEDTRLNRDLDRLKEHPRFAPKYSTFLTGGFALISLALISLYFLELLSVKWVLVWFFTGLGITGIYLKKVNTLSAKVDKVQQQFQQYHKLLQLIEEEVFSTELLCKEQEKISLQGKKASVIIQSFSQIISALDQRANLLFGVLGNGFLLWDIRQSSRLEKWIDNHLEEAYSWFDVITTMDAYNSLGNFVFNHPHFVFPVITGNSTITETKDAVHPLIPEKEAVTNSFKIQKEAFFIITGANMAGKSTFLRTVSLQIIMSNMGLPVRAKACFYTPIKLITSMRTSDSLADESSYFYAELSRLKYIVDKLKEDAYFIVLDEILKGTNSKDKAMGSKKFLEKLVQSHSSGIIATHDLSLCEVSEHLPQVKNYYFDAQIINDELYFDYQFKEGICQHMNASFLLKKMQIVD